MKNTPTLATIEEIIDDARHGKMFILVDDEERENEGDLVIPAQMASPDVINFMATHGRGLICLSLTRERVEHLGLPLMAQHNQTRHQTAFTVSIEAKDGISTGISAPDRARTVAVAIDPSATRHDIITPGHIFPLVAKDGGVLVRAGHTEAAVDVARLAGLNPSGVICEILKEDGTMARLPDLVIFAQKHGLKIATIADLIAYRRRYDTLVRRTIETTITSRFGGEFKAIIYVNTVEYAEHIALVKGTIDPNKPLLVRMHTANVLFDALGDSHGNKDGQLQQSMQMIAKDGNGVVVLLREPNRQSLSKNFQTRLSPPKTSKPALRDYGIGAQILRDLGVQKMELLTNSPRSVVGLDGYDLEIVGYREISA